MWARNFSSCDDLMVNKSGGRQLHVGKIVITALICRRGGRGPLCALTQAPEPSLPEEGGGGETGETGLTLHTRRLHQPQHSY